MRNYNSIISGSYKGNIETIEKVGNGIQLSKEEIEETKHEKMIVPNTLFRNAKMTWTMKKPKPIFWNARVRECTTKGDTYFNPESSVGKGKVTNGLTLFHNTPHRRKRAENKKHNPTTAGVDARELTKR